MTNLISFFNNLRISVRLAVGFVAVLALTVVVGLVGITSAANLADITNRFHDHPFTVVDNVGKAESSPSARSAWTSRDLLLAETTPEIAKIEAAIEQDEKAYLDFMGVAKGAFLGDKTLFDKAIAAYSDYKAVVAEIAAKVRSGDHVAALSLLHGKGAEISKINADMN